ncbi:MAG: malate dehydrogenase [Gracilibacter sp. BRH_c7a]|nr:MAG: malate dehydrogenase [Gracilibacter sp. BRH_c7a]
MSKIKNLREEALAFHTARPGKLEVRVTVPASTRDDLTLAYSPGVAEPVKEIGKDLETLPLYTNQANFVSIVSDGTAILGLGNLGAAASMPVMEGKALLFKVFGDVDAFPLCVNTNDVDKIVEIVELTNPTFGGVNLEDIKAPQCFEIEGKLKERGVFKGPIFHDDQHGTAVVTLAGLYNALKVVNKKMEDVKVVVNGAGAAGIAIVKLLMAEGLKNVIMCDTKGAIYDGRPVGMNKWKDEIAKATNLDKFSGDLAGALVGADIFIGVSVEGAMTQDMIKTMAKDPIIFAQANPVPEIWPEEAYAAGAKIVSTGRSDLPNQVNNVLAFPGIFRGAIDVRATDINDAMKIAAARAIADALPASELNAQNIIPFALDPEVAPAVAAATAKAAIESGIARNPIDPAVVAENLKKRLANQYK